MGAEAVAQNTHEFALGDLFVEPLLGCCDERTHIGEFVVCHVVKIKQICLMRNDKSMAIHTLAATHFCVDNPVATGLEILGLVARFAVVAGLRLIEGCGVFGLTILTGWHCVIVRE